jgi:hypothetical protein
MSEPIYAVVSPEGLPPDDLIVGSPPLTDLSTAVVAELWDYRFKGDLMFTVIKEELEARYPGIQFVPFVTFGDTHGADEEGVVARLPEMLERYGCTAAVSSVGA